MSSEATINTPLRSAHAITVYVPDLTVFGPLKLWLHGIVKKISRRWLWRHIHESEETRVRRSGLAAGGLSTYSIGIYHSLSSVIKMNITYSPSLFPCLCSTYSFPPFFLHSINVEEMWLEKEQRMRKFPCCVCISTREQQFFKNDPCSNISKPGVSSLSLFS